ncbi:PREDICTED: sortilin-related receptor-like [Priapulus caudatus]|uniref:Sortilin-related receptor-like n=1 Tax=Priapulus caudatus TaxID=37621 RepID=A0ABM1ECL6_PRICU|nr:PREDICTED: sortilin-related receptor-like [Priapulus caudatus]
MAMLSRFKLFLATLACLYLFDFPLVSCARFGSKATTLHFPSKTAEDKFRNSEHVLQYDGSGFPAGQQAKQVLREKRKAAGESTTVTPTPTTGHPPPDVTFVHMNDSHHQLIVLWAGQGSDVLVALARDIAQNNQSTSRVFISYDYGLTFEERIGPGKAVGAGMIINHFYNSPVVSSHYVFTDTVHNATLSTQDYGRSFKRHDCPFRPTQISMHSENSDFILGMDEKDPAKRLWISEDFGSTWSILQYRVKSYFWGVTPYDAADTIYVEREDPSGLSTVFRFEDYLTTDQMVVMKNVVDFEVRDKYMFATRKVNLLGARNETLQLWVSYDRGPFLRAIFPGNLRELDYYIPDASEDQVFVCVNHEGIRTHLYISNVQGTSFTLSMEDILYFNPEGAGKDTWVSLFLDETFADFHKVEGLRGVYIASQVKNGSFSMDNTITLITFDKGGLWDRLQPPRFDNHGNRIDCDMSKNCSLHLTQRFAQLSQTSQDMRILSKESAPGLILATGTIGTSLKRDSLVFVSTTGGVTWYQILDAHYFFTFADHGGVIVAARQFAKTNELKYSWNFGKTWETYLLGDEMHIYGILTEPGEKTTIFTLFGSKIDAHQWILVKIDMAPVLGRNCTDEDYKLWTASDDRTTDACLLGRRTTYQRRQTFARCYNGRDYDRPITSSNCSCTREDFECSVGYTENTYNECIANDYVAFDSGLGSCPEGLIVPHTRGYRRVPGDTCEGGQIDVYAPKMVPCEVKRM